MDWLQSLDWAAFHIPIALQGANEAALLSIADEFASNGPLKMIPLVLLLLHAWLRREGRAAGSGLLAAPEPVMRGMLALLIVLVAGRLLQNLLPMRPRPRFMHPEIPFPETRYAFGLDDWSSMPSDHAMLVGAIAVILWAASRRAGLLGAAWGFLFVCLPRVVFGLHYASDILVGLFLGIALAALVLRLPLPAFAVAWLRWLDERRPSLVVLGLFLFGWSLGELFATARSLAAILRKALPLATLSPGLLLAAACVALGSIVVLRSMRPREVSRPSTQAR